MIDELRDVLRRQTAAATQVESRLRAVELIVAAGEQRFLGIALDDLEQAGEHLAALELMRTLALSGAGLSPDVEARELIAATADPAQAEALTGEVVALGEAVARVEDARSRTDAIVARSASGTRERMQAATAFQSY